MDKNLKHDPDYAIEEQDDPRTADAYSEGGSHDEMSHGTFVVEIPGRAQQEDAEMTALVNRAYAISRYYEKLRALVNLTGQVSYHWHMKKGLEMHEPDIEKVSVKYKRNYLYYDSQWKKLRYKSILKIRELKEVMDELGMDYSGIDERTLLNMFAMDKDRRRAFRDYIATNDKKYELHSIEFFETKYQKRLEKRLNAKK